MKCSTLSVCLAVLLIPLSVAGVAAQEVPKIELPAACNTGDASGQRAMGQDMMKQMQDTGGNVSEASKGYMQAMMAMEPPMMKGAMAPDADVAFNCAMIAHHQGAIEMAKVQLKFGKDEESKKMAQKTIDQQGKEVAEMTKWLEEHASK